MFRTLRNDTLRTEQHTLTVREVARLFEEAGVPRTERSIINWCQANHQGVARLNAFFDTNDRKYFIAPQSVELAIREEQAKHAAIGQENASQETPESLRKSSEQGPAFSEETDQVNELRVRVRDLKITNRVKDQLLERLDKERERLLDEREAHVHELMGQSHRIEVLEAR